MSMFTAIPNYSELTTLIDSCSDSVIPGTFLLETLHRQATFIKFIKKQTKYQRFFHYGACSSIPLAVKFSGINVEDLTRRALKFPSHHITFTQKLCSHLHTRGES